MSIFSKTPFKKKKYSTFNLSHQKKMSLSMGDLIPHYIQEVVPGDNISLSTQNLMRLMPTIHPLMHEVNVTQHFFYVPNRILWKKWEKFITGGESGLDNTLPIYQNENYDVKVGSLADYLGLPLGEIKDFSILPFLAYQKIYDEYYRDQNLIEPLFDDEFGALSDISSEEGGFDFLASYGQLDKLRKRAWQHDYFTSALPFAQKGEGIKLPLFRNDELIGLSYSAHLKETQKVRRASNGELWNGTDHQLGNNGSDVVLDDVSGTGDTDVHIDVSQTHFLDPDDAVANAASITDLRRAFKLQEWLEKNARAGSRYVESLLVHFGVISDDASIQRPEYLGGSSSPIMFSEVLQTSQSDQTALGEMGGHGLNVDRNFQFKKYCKEHGYIIGIVSITPKTAYQQGLPKHFSRFDKFDYFWPEFEHIGEQEIKNKELLYTGSNNDEEVFGYIPRYSEYKYMPSTVHGYMKDNLSAWHLGRIFDKANPPALNQEFIECNPRTDIFAVQDDNEHKIICQFYHNVEAKRLMSYYGEPKF